MSSIKHVKGNFYVRYKDGATGREVLVPCGRDHGKAVAELTRINAANVVAGVCAWCETSIPQLGPGQIAAKRKGQKVYCSSNCRCTAAANLYQGRPAGPCKTCGMPFRSTSRGRQYCSLKCYTESPQLAERLKRHNEEAAETAAMRRRQHAEVVGACAEARARDSGADTCFHCGQPTGSRKRKYCNADCRRAFYTARFDRWIANPQDLALPQNYDEFLLQEELPCLVPGCDWVGKSLTYHANTVHGITAEKFKELAGFNHGTGLVAPSTRKAMREHTRRRIAEGELSICGEQFVPGNAVLSSRRNRPEAREHSRKARALIEAAMSPRPPRPCRQCGMDVEQPATGVRCYCSNMCRSRYYTRKGFADLLCSYCGETFAANRTQVNRAKRGQNVCCSATCRNRLNIIAALAARNLTLLEAHHADRG